MANVVVFFAQGFEEIEGLATVDILRRAGHTVHTVGLGSIDALVLPGGLPGATHLRDDETLIKKLKEYSKKGKIIAAICAAPIALHRAGLLKDKKYTCYPGVEKDIHQGSYTGHLVEVDGKLITGCGPAATFEFAYTIAEALGTDTSALREGMQYNKLLNP